MRDVELADYERMFARWRIHTGTRDDAIAVPLYAAARRCLGRAAVQDPRHARPPQRPHGAGHRRRRARPELPGADPCASHRLPRECGGSSLSRSIRGQNDAETWTRSFGDQTFSSAQFARRGRNAQLLCERFGWLTFAMALVVERGRLSLVLRRWQVFGIPLPMWLCPRVDAYESVADERLRFHVDIRHPWTGLIVRYGAALSSPTRA
jgi:hypothetical protein